MDDAFHRKLEVSCHEVRARTGPHDRVERYTCSTNCCAGRGVTWAIKDVVLALVARGLPNADVGRELFIGEAPVKTHLVRAFAKLEVTDRTAAVTAAYGLGLIDLPRP